MFIYLVSNKLVCILTLLIFFLVQGGHWMSKVECTVTLAADSWSYIFCPNYAYFVANLFCCRVYSVFLIQETALTQDCNLPECNSCCLVDICHCFRRILCFFPKGRQRTLFLTLQWRQSFFQLVPSYQTKWYHCTKDRSLNIYCYESLTFHITST